MTKQKKEKKNKLFFLLLIMIFFQSQFSYLNADEIKFKKFDLKCKSQKFLDKTKEYQKNGEFKIKSDLVTKKIAINLENKWDIKIGIGTLREAKENNWQFYL